jgi:hypothetical protein
MRLVWASINRHEFFDTAPAVPRAAPLGHCSSAPGDGGGQGPVGVQGFGWQFSRVTFHMTKLAHERMLHSIKPLGTRVAPLVRNAHAENVGAVTQSA